MRRTSFGSCGMGCLLDGGGEGEGSGDSVDLRSMGPLCRTSRLAYKSRCCSRSADQMILEGGSEVA